jgi:hypothetical protein
MLTHHYTPLAQGWAVARLVPPRPAPMRVLPPAQTAYSSNTLVVLHVLTRERYRPRPSVGHWNPSKLKVATDMPNLIGRCGDPWWMQCGARSPL